MTPSKREHITSSAVGDTKHLFLAFGRAGYSWQYHYPLGKMYYCNKKHSFNIKERTLKQYIIHIHVPYVHQTHYHKHKKTVNVCLIQFSI